MLSDPPVKLNIAKIFGMWFKHIKEERSIQYKILSAGHVTKIAKYLEIDLDGFTEIKEKDPLDIVILEKYNFFTPTTDESSFGQWNLEGQTSYYPTNQHQPSTPGITGNPTQKSGLQTLRRGARRRG